MYRYMLQREGKISLCVLRFFSPQIILYYPYAHYAKITCKSTEPVYGLDGWLSVNALSPQTSTSRVTGSRQGLHPWKKTHRVKVQVQASWDFPGGSIGGESALQSAQGVAGSVPGRGTKIPHPGRTNKPVCSTSTGPGRLNERDPGPTNYTEPPQALETTRHSKGEPPYCNKEPVRCTLRILHAVN